ncbi:hypothetical protein F5Y19DRAFT_458934 [Xylariaceae sp. FL1651]|nr:hypothetical protein F5Y19DRAFT_458934 [Xylariaceae sp. FL1651]
MPVLRPSVAQFWQAVVKRLLSRSPPGTLSLHLVCHTTDVTFISLILQPFADYPGILKDFDLDLGPGNDINSKSQAPVPGLKLPVLFKHPTVTAKPFRYSHLPAEIQEQILVHTDLVTPCKEIYWNIKRGYCLDYKIWNGEEQYCNRSLHFGCPLRSCPLSNCSSQCRLPGSTHRPRYAPGLQCWQSPQLLMLVNRAMYADAIRILWKYNRIIIYP